MQRRITQFPTHRVTLRVQSLEDRITPVLLEALINQALAWATNPPSPPPAQGQARALNVVIDSANALIDSANQFVLDMNQLMQDVQIAQNPGANASIIAQDPESRAALQAWGEALNDFANDHNNTLLLATALSAGAAVVGYVYVDVLHTAYLVL